MFRLGYISPDFRRHSVGYFIEPVLRHHNRRLFEVICYSDVLAPDALTQKLSSYASKWYDTSRLNDKDLYELIKSDRLDGLIDLAGHTGYNRLPVFALKPAPKQITWIGYANTTGLEAVDYRIVDSFTDPLGLTDGFNSERLLRMPHCFLCFGETEGLPAINTLPLIKNGFVTFGSFNNLAKINDFTLSLWAELLHAIEGSRLILKSKAFNDAWVREYTLARLKRYEIDSSRVTLYGHLANYDSHLMLYNSIDLALDTYPYSGTTTTFEALYMGVPVITLAGTTHASRVSLSILRNLALDFLVAYDKEDFVLKAKAVLHDIAKLSKLRQSLRDTMKGSPLMDCEGFTKAYEKLLLEVLA